MNLINTLITCHFAFIKCMGTQLLFFCFKVSIMILMIRSFTYNSINYHRVPEDYLQSTSKTR